MSATSDKERFTAWLSAAERAAVRSAAREHGTSENYIVRMCVRKTLGMPVPTAAPARPTVETDQL